MEAVGVKLTIVVERGWRNRLNTECVYLVLLGCYVGIVNGKQAFVADDDDYGWERKD